MAVIRHEDSWVDKPALGKVQPYRPTYSESLTLGPTHRRLLEAPLKPGSAAIDIGIPGSLRREDAAKLYELAFFGQGDVLILGLGHGLGAAIVAQAFHDGGHTGAIIGVDGDARAVTRTRASLDTYNFTEMVEVRQESPLALCRSYGAKGRLFGLVFADHSTAYADVVGMCRLLPSLVDEGGFVLFHDFNDRRNRDASHGNGHGNGGYGVYTGVIDGLPSPPFAFYGSYGCTGLYRKVDLAAVHVGNKAASGVGLYQN